MSPRIEALPSERREMRTPSASGYDWGAWAEDFEMVPVTVWVVVDHAPIHADPNSKAWKGSTATRGL